MSTPTARVSNIVNKKLLIVDDDSDTRYVLSLILKSEGYEVVTATDGQAALSVLTDTKLDLIITDINMPRMNGLELIRNVRQIQRISRIPIIVITAYGGLTLKPALTAGANVAMRKPLVFTEFLPIIRNLIADSSSNPSEEESDDKPGIELLKPIENTITLVNNNLLSIFKNDPDGVRNLDPFRFEQLVADLFQDEGYEVVVTPPRGDGGKDIYVYKKDPITNLMFLVECKRYVPPNTVGVSVARQLYGVVQQERANAGIIVTTSYFTKPAQEFAATIPYQLFLRDYDYLVEWLKRVKLD